MTCQHHGGREGYCAGHAQDDTLVGAVLGRELRPDRGELVVGRATLGDDLAVPACVVVLCGQVSISCRNDMWV